MAARAPLPAPAELTELLDAAAAEQNLFAVQWLVAREVPWPAQLHAGWKGECLEFIRDAGCDSPVQEVAMHPWEGDYEHFAGLFDMGFVAHMNFELMEHIEL